MWMSEREKKINLRRLLGILLITIAFVVLKLNGFISLSWIWIFSPIWIVFFLFIILGIIVILCS